jgi:hypothetical protein
LLFGLWHFEHFCSGVGVEVFVGVGVEVFVGVGVEVFVGVGVGSDLTSSAGSLTSGA